jgi:membrane protein required for colicin V production
VNAALPALAPLDWLLLAVLAVSVLVGLWRGFVFECLSLAGWVVAWFAAQWGAPLLRPWVPLFGPDSPVRLGLCFAIAFVAALVAWALLARLVRLLIHATPLSLPDRALGAAFGALRGVVLLLAVATVVALTPASQSQAWRGSQGARWLDATLLAVRPLLPAPVARALRPRSEPQT